MSHVLAALLYYAVNLATRSIEPRPSGQADASLPVSELLDALEGRAAVLAEICAHAAPDARGAHDWGRPDVSGFAALACNEMLVHTDDIVLGMGGAFDPPLDVCARVLTRLFPWAPGDQDPWETLRWANGRAALGKLPRLGPSWVGHPSPLDQWDGRNPNDVL